MSATYNVVDIGGNSYEVFADVATADLYLAAESTAAKYRAADAETKAMWAVSATRILNRQNWAGSKTDPDQALAFPRTGISGVDEETIPQGIIDAACEMMNQMANGYDPANTQNTSNTVKRQKAGSVEIEYFRGVEGVGYRFPLPVWELIRQFIGGSSIAGALASGVCGDSKFDDSFDRAQPF